MPTIIEIITSDLKLMTSREIASYGRGLEEPEAGEVLIGDVPQGLWPMWGLQHDYLRKAKLAFHAALFDVDDMADKEAMETQARRFMALSSLTREFAWSESREHLGDIAWSRNTLSIRSGYRVYSSKPDAEEPTFTQIPLSALGLDGARIFRDAVTSFLEKRSEAEPEKPSEPEKGKPH